MLIYKEYQAFVRNKHGCAHTIYNLSYIYLLGFPKCIFMDIDFFMVSESHFVCNEGIPSKIFLAHSNLTLCWEYLLLFFSIIGDNLISM